MIPIFLKVLLTMLASVLGVNLIANSPSAKAIALATRPSVGVVVAQGSTGISTGTAFVAGEGLILTAHHVVVGTDGILLKFPDHPAVEPRVIATDTDHDLAVLTMPGLAIRPLPLGDVAQVQEGEKIVVISAQIDAAGTQTNTVTEAVVNAIDATLLTIKGPMTSASRGGLVLNLRAEVIGLVRGPVRGEQNEPVAVTPANAVKQLLSAALSSPASVAPTPAPPAAQGQPTPNPAPQVSSTATPDSFLVLPGQSIGPVKLGMDIQDVTALLGPHKTATKLPDGSVVYGWFEPPQYDGLGVRATEAGIVDSIWALNTVKYIVKDRLRVGSTEAEVRAVLGEPSIVNLDFQAQTRTLLYGSLGMWFTIQLNPQYEFYNTVNEIGVMQPSSF